MILQKLKKQENDVYLIAERYYTIISAVNNLKFTQREVQLVAFTAVKGNISYANIRKEFCQKYGTTNASINNIVSRLKKMGILVKDGTKVKVNPVILLNFEKDVVLEIRLLHK
jgi:hypothetical protein